MPTVEVALAMTGTVFETVARFAGAVMVADTPVLLIVSVTGIVCGELEAAGSLIVAVALYVPRAKVAGFTMKEMLVVALPAREPDVRENVSHVWVLDADQLRVVLVAPAFFTTTDCVEVAVLPCTAEKLRVEVGTERTAWFATVTVIEVEVAVLL
jgi:hypothetical protein